MEKLPTGAVTFLFTDIEGSTRLWEEQHDVMEEVVSRHDELMREMVNANDGYVFATGGDSFSAAFSDPREAVATAIECQQALAMESWGVGELRVRMGIHSGVAHERDGDYFGPTLNRTARIMSAGHGGQVLVSGAVDELVAGRFPSGVELRFLGEFRLKDLGEPERLSQLIHPDLIDGFLPLRTLDSHLNNLPLELSSFVGRLEELEESVGCLRLSRLVTLTGVGGSGKTRLALQTAAEALDDFADGVWMVELADLGDAGDLPRWVEQEMGISRSGGQGGETEAEKSANRVAEYLASRTSLLVLDNCEHVISAVARFADFLLKRSPGLKILATSREGLGIPGEQLIQVPSLALPPENEEAADQVGYADAMKLFIERAYSTDPRFELTREIVPAVAGICRRLDGMPLAIELAAARVRVLSPEQIADRLSDSFRLLTGGSRTALPRQQTLRATVDWSYDLLSEEERYVFDRFAVFRGGFTLEAAEAIASGDSVDESSVFEALASLVDKSMVQPAAASGRFGLLETLRQYATDRLSESGETERWRQIHAEYYADVADTAYDATRDHRQAEWFGLLESDHENFKAAVIWARESGLNDLAARIGRGLWWFWFSHSHVSVGTETLTALIESGDLEPPMLAQAFHARAWMTISKWVAAGLEDAEQAVSLAREIGEDQLLARMSVALVPILVVLERFDEEQQVFDQAYRAAGHAGDEWVQGRLALNHGFGLWVKAESASDDLLAGADRWFDLALRHFTASGVQLGLAHTLSQKGIIARALEDHKEAISFFEKANELYVTLGDRERAAFNEFHIAIALIKAGNPEAALTHVTSGAAVVRELGVRTLSMSGIEAVVRADTGDFAGAVEALQGGSEGFAEAERQQVAIFGLHVARLANRTGAYEDAARLAGFAKGMAGFTYGLGSLTDMVSEQVVEELDQKLPTWKEIAATWEESSVTEVIGLVSSVLDRLSEA